MNGNQNGHGTQTRPERVLLQMAIKDGDWAGVAIRFRTEEHHRFGALRELLIWLCRLRRETPRTEGARGGDPVEHAVDSGPD